MAIDSDLERDSDGYLIDPTRWDEALAESLDVDFEAVQAEMDSPRIAGIIAENHRLAQAMQVSGTPSFVMGDQMLRGYVPLAQMQEMVAAQRAE